MSHYAEDIHRILASLNEPGDEEADTTTPLSDKQTVNVIHVYPVEGGGILFSQTELEPEDDKVVDSTPSEHSKAEVSDQEIPSLNMKREASKALAATILAVCLVMLLIGFTIQSLSVPAIITIVTSEHQISTNAVFTLPATLLKKVTFAEAGNAPATGKGHQDAMQAHGIVTFYNSLPQPQTIEAGTLLADSGGVQIVTDQTAYIPAGSFSGNGQISVSAHAVNSGPAGNIAAGDIGGTCCREYILVRNNASFTGGQNARDFQTVSPTDIKGIESTLLSKINGELLKAQGYIPTSDTLIDPIPCSTAMNSDHKAGDEALSVSVAVAENCSIISYNTQAFNEKITAELSQSLLRQFGAGFTLLGSPTIRFTDTKIQSGQIDFSVASSALYGLDFSRERTNGLAKLVAGKSKQEALKVLTQERGVDEISLDIPNYLKTLPKDTTRIHFVVVYQPIENIPT